MRCRSQQPTRRGEQVGQDGMHLALFAPVGAAAPPDHAENGAELRDRRQQANHDVATAGVEALQDLRRPDINGAEGIGQAEVGEGIHQHRWRQYFAQRGTRRSRDDRRMFPFAIDHRLQRLFLFVIQPVGFIRRVVEEEPVTTPSTTDGRPSSRNSHCQPFRFHRPSSAGYSRKVSSRASWSPAWRS